MIGGGIAGLAAAVRISRATADASVVLVESRPRVGGVLNTVVRDGFLVEEAADSFAVGGSERLQELCHQIRIEDQLVSASEKSTQAMVMHENRFRPLPAGFLFTATPEIVPLLTTRLLSLAGKCRLALEPFVWRKRSGEEESVAQFIRRRLGSQAYERLVRPIAEAIYGADPARLSADATIPRLVDMERTYGSLFRGTARSRVASQLIRRPVKSAKRSGTVTPRSGMGSLVEAFTKELPSNSILTGAAVTELIRVEGDRWGLVLSGTTPRLLVADAVVIAAPAFEAARMAKKLAPLLARELAGIEYSGRVNVSLGYSVEQIRQMPAALGYFFPRSGNSRVRSLSVTSEKFPDRAPRGHFQFRVSVADGRNGLIAPLNDDELVDAVSAELAAVLPLQGKPCFRHVVRHRFGVPQYSLGHVARVNRIDRLVGEYRGITLAGAAYRGAAVPQCIASGERAADAIAQYLTSARVG